LPNFDKISNLWIKIEEELIKLSQLLNQTPIDGLTLSSANCLFIDSNLKLLDPYVTETQRLFQNEPESVPFADDSNEAVQRINDWANEKTHGKIAKMFDRFDAKTNMIIANAIYFKVNVSKILNTHFWFTFSSPYTLHLKNQTRISIINLS